MDKAPDAFRTISEVAEHLETPAHVLRFWETRFPQVKPVKGAGGRRYYRPADVALLAGIRRLLHNDGMTIRGVQKILRENGVRHVAELGGAEPAAPEPLADLLPPARPEAEVVPLRPPVAAEPARLAPPEEPAPEPDLDTPPPAPTFAPPIPGFGGFGLDLDAPRSGSEGFIAFSDAAQPRPPATATGFVHPEARPKPREEPPRQPTLFDLDAPTDAAIVEEDVEEAPFIHVSDEAPAAAEIAHFAPQPESEPDSEAEAAVAALLAGISEDESSPVLAEPLPETDAGFVFPGLPDPDPASPAEEPVEAHPALAELAGLVPRLRRLSGVAAEEVLPLADLQARLGLLHAQMVEAQARARRNHGA